MRRLALPVTLLALLGARAFDGTDDAYVIDNPNKPATVFTVCFWAYTANFVDDQAVVAYGNGNAASGRGWSVRTVNEDSTTGRYRLSIYNGTGSQGLTTPPMSEAAWHHVCFVRSGNFDNPAYVDATDAASDATHDLDLPPTSQNSTDDLLVGKTPPNLPGDYGDFNGRLAHVAYWDAALTGSQIASLADKSTCPTAVAGSNLQSFLNMPPSGAVVDGSANAFTVTAEGTPTADAGPGGLPCAAPPAADHVLILKEASNEL